jgi:hypothetical protein
MERVWLRAMDNVDQNYSVFDLRAGNRRLKKKVAINKQRVAGTKGRGLEQTRASKYFGHGL